ncbi:MAG: gamma-glutamyltransferase family protein, partial [Rhizobacter sp.]|nr:gamma-glutamyltransferase family protein [Rhizobacter sp.]
NFMGFGSGVVVPGTGISLNNRGSGFTLEAGHPNRVAGSKRPFHTILPALLSRGGTPLCALGVVGANMQPQGHVQLISAMEDLGLNPQAALDMPRWRIADDGRIRLEADVAAQVAQGLLERGHDVEVRPADDIEFGGAQMAWRHEGGWIAASDPRRDGIAAGF